ncbi:hypothetical protein [Nostoc sp. UHCC 0870]|uniref:hypothetical protein n=1 Tax=Nostoc sp. UHCC 0870 TaxID=2914041 RepID=UPI001EDF38B2|nr:hypothetical protein [Nostoc sp. UHCC 0870]UKO98533.1 hypothetical protein L6494_02000 [Nostoc sp. UHCC 0870]
MKEHPTRHANTTRKVYFTTTILSGLLLLGSVSLENMGKIPDGATGDLTKVAVVMIDKTRRMYNDEREK